jgi:AraC-like DNA-binding protein
MTTLRVPDRFRVPKIVWIWLERLGLTPMAVLRHARLPSALHDGERTAVTTAQFFALWRSIAELRPQPDLGLRLARELELGQLPPATLASFYARDYRDALGRLSRFKQLCAPEEMHLHEARGQCTVELEWMHAREPTPPLLVDATLALILELGRRGTQAALKPVRVELVRRRGAKRALEDFFGCAVSLGATRDMLVLRAGDLARRFVTYNPELLEMLQPSLVMALSGQQQDGAARAQVKWTLKCLLADNRPDIRAVSRELGVSSRTLQRRIAEEGATFRELLAEARRELARTYLREPSIEINQLAHLVGYEDPNSFYRAFRSWEGTTPGRWRSRDEPAGTGAYVRASPAPRSWR